MKLSNRTKDKIVVSVMLVVMVAVMIGACIVIAKI